MGNIISNYIKKIKKLFEKKANLLMLGLDNAGKTTILYKLKLTTLVSTVPTIGFNVETLKYKSLQLTIWDVGGQEKIRPLWKYYYKDINAIVFIIDSNDSGRFMEAKKELHYLANENELQNIRFLILCNKQDLEESKSIEEITKVLELNNIKQKHYIQSCSAVNNCGIYEGFEWLYNDLKS